VLFPTQDIVPEISPEFHRSLAVQMQSRVSNVRESRVDDGQTLCLDIPTRAAEEPESSGHRNPRAYPSGRKADGDAPRHTHREKQSEKTGLISLLSSFLFHIL
jgi:hypothetical protein